MGCEVPCDAAGRPLDPILAEECDRQIVHGLFGLTYASYLVWPRLVLQSMPGDWQRRLKQLHAELVEQRGKYLDGEYEVRMRDEKGRFLHDPLSNYRRGRLEDIR